MGDRRCSSSYYPYRCYSSGRKARHSYRCSRYRQRSPAARSYALSIVWGSRIAVACSAVCFIAAIRVYYAPTSPCSGCSLSWCSHLPPSRHCFTWAHATSPNYDGWPQAPVIRRADLLHRLRQTRQFLLRCHASSCFLFSCVFMPALLLWLYRQWLSVLPFRP